MFISSTANAKAESDPRNISRRLAQSVVERVYRSPVPDSPYRRQRSLKFCFENVKDHALVGLAQVVFAIIPAIRRQRDHSAHELKQRLRAACIPPLAENVNHGLQRRKLGI